MKIYFARSIRGDSTVPVEELQKSLAIFGEVLSENFDFSKDVSRDKKIFEKDMALLETADVVIAEISNPSLGVGYEIATAVKLCKPILCLAKNGIVVSAMITGNPACKVEYYSDIADAHARIQLFLSEKKN